MKIHPLNPIAYPCQYLVWYSIEGIGQYSYGEVVAENLHTIAFLTWDVGHINHTDIHADVTYIFRLLAVYKSITMAVAEMTVEAVCIAYRNSGYHAVLLKDGATAVTYTFSCRNMANLENGGLQCADI